jgi:AraC family transcriptional regulator of adaptative response / DNA-3-methyladenine glycosylase II
MYSRLLAGDPTWNGRFFTGVRTTGIYCLPSCKARKPKSENFTFFPTCEAARASGLRPCKKCHPDDYARGADPVRETIETVVTELRETPARYRDARAVVTRAGFGSTRAFELFRLHYHATPAELLTRARVDFAASQLLATRAALLDGAADAGFESVSAFHDQFRRLTGLTPGDYRRLPKAKDFAVQLPVDTSVPHLRRALSRDPHSLTERWVDDTYTCVVRLAGEPALLTLRFADHHVHVTTTCEAVNSHRVVAGLLGLRQDAEGFFRLARKLGLGRLVRDRGGLRISQTHSVFEGLLWAIIGQQINFPFACQLRRRLYELAGTPVAEGLIAPPTPESGAALKPTALIARQFSRQKAAYVIDTARLVASGSLDLENLATASATTAERILLAVRGLGP